MTQYREYAALHGGKVRVPVRTISQTSSHYDRGSYPYVAMAQQLGKDRDRFAMVAMSRRPFYEEASRDRSVPPLVKQAEPLPA